nr:MAG TPA: hypothetical protein [Caudoviricetes sp.]
MPFHQLLTCFLSFFSFSLRYVILFPSMFTVICFMVSKPL